MNHLQYLTNDVMGGSDGLIKVIIIIVIMNNGNSRPSEKEKKNLLENEYEETSSPKWPHDTPDMSVFPVTEGKYVKCW